MYKITKQEPIALYGGSNFGIAVARSLIREGYNVVCILDRNPSGVENSPVPVFTPGKGYEAFGAVFVYISLTCGEEHMPVSMGLKALGFDRLLFLPLFLRSAAAKTMITAWNLFFTGMHDVDIPHYDHLWKASAIDNITENGSGFVTSVIHKSHVHTTRITSQIANYENNPLRVFAYVPKRFIPEFDFFNRSNERFYDASIDSVLSDSPLLDGYLRFSPYREGVLPMLERILFSPSEFYAEQAVSAEWNEKGHFNIIDGHHRVFFLLNKGLTGIPLRVKKSEWERYFREPEAQALMDICKDMDSLPFAVNHPAFVRFPVIERKPDSEFLRLYEGLYPWN